MGIYVEIAMHTSMVELWKRTQTPDLHAQWDLRFTDIEYLPRHDGTQPQRFRYTTRIGFGLAVCGEGETSGTPPDASGKRTSALKFWSDDPKSLIAEGAGYWQYIQYADHIRFLTWYDYRARYGALGRAFDRSVFRPLLGWATAWSFDRLRLWLEKDLDPATALRNSLILGFAQIALVISWLGLGMSFLWGSDTATLVWIAIAGGALALYGYRSRLLVPTARRCKRVPGVRQR